jgi:hypothetical protein
MRKRRGLVLGAVVVVLVTACATGSSFKPFDFDGDNKADHVWRDQSTGTWYEGSTPGATVRYLGAPSDVPVAADYDGDGRYDVAVIKANGDWVTGDGSVIKAAFPAPPTLPSTAPPLPCCSQPTVVPVPGDYDGDKKAEPGWFREYDGTWFFADGSVVTFGGGITDPTNCCLLNNDGRVPVPADFDGDKKTDLAVFNPLTGDWTIRRSSDGTVETVKVMDRPSASSPLQLPAPADYDGVGHAQPAILDPYGWHIAGHAEPIAFVAPLGTMSLPAPADYDGDGKADLSYLTPDGAWRTQGGPDVTVSVPPTSLLPNFPAELPRSLSVNIARMVLVGKNLMDCASNPALGCAGY